MGNELNDECKSLEEKNSQTDRNANTNAYRSIRVAGECKWLIIL